VSPPRLAEAPTTRESEGTPAPIALAEHEAAPAAQARADVILRARRPWKNTALRIGIGAVVAAIVGTIAPALDLNPADETHDPRAVLLAAAANVDPGLQASESVEATMKFRAAVFDVRPVPTPEAPEPAPVVAAEAAPAEVAPAPAAPPGSITEIIYAAADEYGVDRAWLLSIASCESGLNPNAHNPAGYYGLFQFDEATWAENGYGSIYDPVAQARTAARLIAAGQASRWPSCS